MGRVVSHPGGKLGHARSRTPKVTVDFAWPNRRKLIVFVGLGAHADSRAHAHDTLREDDSTSLGWELRRFAPDSLRHHPEDVARQVLRFLCGPRYAPGRSVLTDGSGSS